jgi:hypothetical protein
MTFEWKKYISKGSVKFLMLSIIKGTPQHWTKHDRLYTMGEMETNWSNNLKTKRKSPRRVPNET